MAIAGTRLFIGQVFSQFLVVADLTTQGIVARLPIGGEGSLAVSRDEQHVYFANNKQSEFFIINAATLSVEHFQYPPGGRGIAALLAHPDNRRLFLGIQRGGRIEGRSLAGGNTYLATFDLVRREYVGQTYLAEVVGPGQSDDSTAHCFRLAPDGSSLYIGMFQSRQGILVADLDTYEVVRGIRFPKTRENHGDFEWVDPLAQGVYGDLLVSVNRHNYELAIVARRDEELLASIALGGTVNGPSALGVVGDRAIVCHDEYEGLLVIDLLGVASSLRVNRTASPTIGRDPQALTPEEIEEFERLRDVPPPAAPTWTEAMRQVPEQRVKAAICEILGDVPRKDWGGETADHFTGALHVEGKRLTGAFLFKGPAAFRANQIQRLVTTEAGVLIVQHAHEIGEDVRKELRVWAREGPYPRYYCFIDGKDTYRILSAYGKL